MWRFCYQEYVSWLSSVVPPNWPRAPLLSTLKLVLLGLAGVLGFFSTATAQTPYTCDGTFYQIRNPSNPANTADLYRINRSVAPYTTTQIGSNISAKLNALGYNPLDNFLYAIQENTSNIYQISAAGAATLIGSVSGLPARAYNSGTFDAQGNYYVTHANTNLVYRLSQSGSTWSATTLTFNATVNTGDIAFDPLEGVLYGLLNTVLIRYNLSNSTVSTSPVNGLPAGSTAGSVFFDAAGTFYAYLNGGSFYTIDTSTGQATFISNATSASGSDGASCVFPNFKVDAVKQTTNVTATDSRTYAVTFRVVVGNRFTTSLPNVQVNDFIGPGRGTAFPTASSVNVVSAPQVTSGPCVANSAFSSSDSRLLNGAVSLSANQSCTLTFTLSVAYAAPSSVPVADPANTVYASSTNLTPNNGYTLQSGTPVPPIQVLAGDESSNASTLPASANGDTPSPTPVALPRSPNVTLVKEVRNQTKGGTFGATAVATPGEVIEYCVRFSNEGSGVAGSLTVTDTLQLEQTFVVSAYASGRGFRVLNGSGSEVATHTSAQDADAAEWNEPASQLSYRNGSLAAGGQGSLCFRAQVR